MPISTSSIETSRTAALGGAILAGGRGRRMGAMSWLPKVLLPVRGRPVLAYQMELLERLGVARVLVVVGYRKELILDYLDTTGRMGKSVEVIEQPEPKGSGDALLCLEGAIRGPFLVFLGDIVFLPNEHLEWMAEPILRGGWAATLAVADEPDPQRLAKNFRVEVDGDERIVGVLEKPADGLPGLKGCGFYGFTPDVFRVARLTPRAPQGDLGITDVVQSLIDLDLPVRAARVCRWDANLTQADDLAGCEAALRGFETEWSANLQSARGVV